MDAEFIKSIKAALYDRTTSPLFGIFLTSWAIINYKFIIVIFSSLSVNDKFQFIENVLYPDIGTYLLFFLVWPTVSTVLLIFVYPYPARFVYAYSKENQRKLNEMKQTIEKNTLLTVEESRAIRQEILLAETNFHEELKRRDQQIESLKEQLEHRNGESDDDVPLPPSSVDEEVDLPPYQVHTDNEKKLPSYRRPRMRQMQAERKSVNDTDNDYDYGPEEASHGQLQLLKIIGNKGKMTLAQMVEATGSSHARVSRDLSYLIDEFNYVQVDSDEFFTLTYYGNSVFVEKNLDEAK